VLDLEMTGSSSDYAQFIECNTDAGTKFKVNGNGDVYTAGNIDVDGNLNVDGNIDVDGKLHGADSGDADMKAYIYGRIDSNGNIFSSAISGGFTASKVATGHYRITFSNSPGASNKYVVVATSYDISRPEVITIVPSTDYFDVYAWNGSTGNAVDTVFYFVVFKK
jgi:hypothetical protein